MCKISWSSLNDVVSGEAVDAVGMDVYVKSRDSRSNLSQDIRAAHFMMANDDAGQPGE